MSSNVRPLLFPLAHLLGLWAFGVAQPLFDILRRNGDFFVAHRAGPTEMVGFAAVISLGLPLLLVLPWIVVALVRPRAGRVVLVGLVALLATALASQVMAHRLALSTYVHYAIAGAIGIAVAWGYARFPIVRSFFSVASIGVVLFPLLFLTQPGMTTFMRGDSHALDARAAIDKPVPPIVFVVFDQLPLTSLMDANGGIDRDHYPAFAELADTATWYRNFSTMADFTGWALPPLLTGLTPTPGRVPTWKTYPTNLFTWLGGHYRLEVMESITQFCPESLCDEGREPLAVRLASMVLDSSVVYGSLALPRDLRALLPPLTENWRDFIAADNWRRRWVVESRRDRRALPEEFIRSISRDDPQPTLYFAHALLPHEPYVLLPSGKQLGADTRMPGVDPRTGIWATDEWLPTLGYRRHLLQVGYVDSLLGRLIARLKEAGLYDDALIVVTSDHGVSFRAGQPFKGVDADTLPDVVSVPLFIKAPGQREGVIDDRNVQSFDVMPTIARLIGVPLTWPAEGSPGGEANDSVKTVFYHNARDRLRIDTATLAAGRDEAVARKVALFGSGPGWPPIAPEGTPRALLGRKVDEFRVVTGPWHAQIAAAERWSWLTDEDVIWPVLVTGEVRDGGGIRADAQLAIAVNGTIAAVTRTFDPDFDRGRWGALLAPEALSPGRNDIRVYVIPDENPSRLHLAYTLESRPSYLNLASRTAAENWKIRQSGFYDEEGAPIGFRWTDGNASLVVPVEPDRVPRSLRVVLRGAQRGGSPLTLTVNDCTLFSDTVQATWNRTLSLRSCPPESLRPRNWEIRLVTPPWKAGDDPRQLGVGVESITLMTDDWPVPDGRTRQARGQLRVVGGTREVRSGTSIEIIANNAGEAVWLPVDEASGAGWPVQLALRWRPANGNAPEHEQRMNIPRAIFPAERAAIQTPLVPPDELRDRGPWKLTIAPVAADGTAIPVESPLTLDVAPGA
ncbi:MAG TPA: sulfatase-like hydrolase/transferase [Vicinamibacterales bacterium]